MGGHRRRLWFAGLTAVLFILALLFAPSVDYSSGDASYYVALARDPFEFTQQPFSYRVAMPSLVWLLPVSLDIGFPLITALCLAATLVWTWTFCAAHSQWGAWIAAALVAVSPVVTTSVQNPYLVDSMAYAVIAGCFVLMERRRWWTLAFAIAFGMAVRESVGAVIPAALVLLWFDRDAESRSMTAAFLVLLPLLVTFGIRSTGAWFGEVPPSYPYLAIDTVRAHMVYVNDGPDGPLLKALVSAFALSWGAGWVAVILRRHDRLSMVAAAYLLPIFASLLIAGAWTRMLFYAFPIIALSVATLTLRTWAAATLIGSVFLVTAVIGPWDGGAVKWVLEGLVLAAGVFALVRGQASMTPNPFHAPGVPAVTHTQPR